MSGCCAGGSRPRRDDRRARRCDPAPCPRRSRRAGPGLPRAQPAARSPASRAPGAAMRRAHPPARGGRPRWGRRAVGGAPPRSGASGRRGCGPGLRSCPLFPLAVPVPVAVAAPDAVAPGGGPVRAVTGVAPPAPFVQGRWDGFPGAHPPERWRAQARISVMVAVRQGPAERLSGAGQGALRPAQGRGPPWGRGALRGPAQRPGLAPALAFRPGPGRRILAVGRVCRGVAGGRRLTARFGGGSRCGRGRTARALAQGGAHLPARSRARRDPA